jgi:hypothetical protein
MDVNVNNAISGANQNIAPASNQNHQGNQDEGNKTKPAAPPVGEAGVYEPSEKPSPDYKPDMNRIKEMWSEHDAKVESFRRLLEGLFGKQAQSFGTANDWKTNLEMVEIDDETRAAAMEEISEGGYYSVDETAKRILNFAIALSGGDPAKIDLLERAAMKGFEAAEKMWGDKLPEISYQTMEAVRNGFDEWRQAGSASAISLLQTK